MGLCAGFQMLGRRVRDPDGVEGPPGETEGLGLLDIDTGIGPSKRLCEITATDAISGTRVTGYEMHMGMTTGAGLDRPWLSLDGRPEGALSEDGRVAGTYLHGIFGSGAFRAQWLRTLGAAGSAGDHSARIETALDRLADGIEPDLDLDALLRSARWPTGGTATAPRSAAEPRRAGSPCRAAARRHTSPSRWRRCASATASVAPSTGRGRGVGGSVCGWPDQGCGNSSHFWIKFHDCW
ncbi:CobB/CobQ-like glutamine amidotransferase-like protein [Cereibacter azotoformans]|uniref:CobB/CobQ-like glutamine amidotransferase-like protein n=2 Tax=Cereibacter azotoformans TaxID=43057 RepID=A0A2T5JSE2_9RHOB|nr:CobB/CobQ-like glutamine amidotransferase-like protein [Cereibacter azotoformans]